MDKKLICFLVVGRMGKTLVYSKAEPFVINQSVGSVYIFSETEGLPMPKTVYVTLPQWILKPKPLFLSRLLRILAEPLQLINAARKIRPDIINGYHLIPKGLNSLLAARLSNARCVISLIGGTVEVETYSSFKWFLKRINLWALRKTDLITTKGLVVKSYLVENKIESSRIFVYNGSVNFKKFYYDPSVTKDIDIIFAGTFRNLKGPDRVLKMIVILKQHFPRIKAILIGNGYLLPKCLEMSTTLKLEENVSFPGHVDESANYFRQAKILVMPSRSEGLPTSMLEAMACGCVPVVSDVGNIREAAIHSENAFLVDDYLDIESFTKYIFRLLSDEKLREGMALKGISTVRDKYTPERQSEIVNTMIENLFYRNVSS